jgi:Ca-activated chloride channel family protein
MRPTNAFLLVRTPPYSPNLSRHFPLAKKSFSGSYKPAPAPQPGYSFAPPVTGEGYASVQENGFVSVADEPLSTFGVDVDQASYANIRRFLNQGQLPPEDAVRLEECVNYFRYEYAAPQWKDPFGITLEAAESPFHRGAKLVLVGLQGRELEAESLPPSNLVFLLDVSGSMNSPDKLPLLQKAFGMLTQQLRAQDKVSLVVYAGAAGLVLPPTSGNQTQTILDALNRLSAGGSTAGGAGLQLAYATARQNFYKNGNNRVILATDGDFNVGPSGEDELQRLIEKERKSGVFLSVLGFGQGNLQDAKMELLADKGNGQYAYIDGLLEARKVLVEQMGGTLHTLAKDVKMQVEFNPAKVSSYRLLGYENRKLAARDFNDDKKDAGELGLGHRVTALYEIIPTGVEIASVPSVDPLKYGAKNADEKVERENRSVKSGRRPSSAFAQEWMTVKFRYKAPEGDKSKLITRVFDGKAPHLKKASENLRFATSVAGFAHLLRNSEHTGALNWKTVLDLGRSARGQDESGYRAEYLRLAELAQSLQAHAEVSDASFEQNGAYRED